jgi:phosphatidylserine decarboxylase
MKIHREGYRYIIIATILWAVVGYLSGNYMHPFWLAALITFLCFVLWAWVIVFFRIPSRNYVHGERNVMAPADGKVVVIQEVYEPEYFKDNRLQVSIFMSPLNVHVNRNPVSGVVAYIKYHPGKYLVAWHPKSSTLNERTTLVINNDRTELLLRQIAGIMARRIRFYVKEGDTVRQNEEFGFIRFGSRVDVFFPLGTKLNVHLGDKVKGGLTLLAQLA